MTWEKSQGRTLREFCREPKNNQRTKNRQETLSTMEVSPDLSARVLIEP